MCTKVVYRYTDVYGIQDVESTSQLILPVFQANHGNWQLFILSLNYKTECGNMRNMQQICNQYVPNMKPISQYVTYRNLPEIDVPSFNFRQYRSSCLCWARLPRSTGPTSNRTADLIISILIGCWQSIWQMMIDIMDRNVLEKKSHDMRYTRMQEYGLDQLIKKDRIIPNQSDRISTSLIVPVLLGRRKLQESSQLRKPRTRDEVDSLNFISPQYSTTLSNILGLYAAPAAPL